MSDNGLTDRQRLFVDAYLQCWNATRAAIAAGYSQKTARQMGAENLSKPVIRKEIDARLKASAMSADEAMARLAAQARASIEDFIDEHGNIDVMRGIERGAGHALKRYKVIDTEHGTRTEIELYDVQSALLNIWKNQRAESGNATDVIDVRVVYDDALSHDDRD